ncbi:MAG TPA: hypothetical protein VHN99_05665 [Deinococcales bacterium]|nr:hypothetical protein [Deinococcales bacterium]
MSTPSDVFVWWVYGGFALVIVGYAARLFALRRALSAEEVSAPLAAGPSPERREAP